MMDLVRELKAIHRAVSRGPVDGAEAVGLVLQREYDATVEDVWDALTDPDRLRRWFLPVTGDLRVGGTFQLEGNAGGDILHCEPPHRLKVTFGGPASLVEVRLSPGAADTTLLELEHTVPIDLAGSGAGALFVGPGWDGMVLALARFLAGEVVADPAAAASSPEGQEFARGSVHAWAATVESSGTATADELTAATGMSLAHFAPDLT